MGLRVFAWPKELSSIFGTFCICKISNENIRKFAIKNIKGYNFFIMENNPVPTTYVKSFNRALEVANAEKPFIDALFIHETIENHFENILDNRCLEREDSYDERKELSVPVFYDYLYELCTDELGKLVDEETVNKVLVNIFSKYMEDYDYRSGNLVPSVPLVYLLSIIEEFNDRIHEHMNNAAIDAERRYIASMN
jgi:hypothetical protein